MIRRVGSALGLCLFLSIVPAASAQVDPAGLIYSLYRKYTGADPTPQQLQIWIREMQKGVSAADVHANLIGSNEYFNRCQRNPVTFVNGVYAEVLSAAPDPKALEYWLDQLRRNRNDRVKWAKQFLKAAGVTIPPGVANPPGVVAPSDLPLRLLTTCQLLLQASQSECAGQAGWLIQNQAKNFVSYVRASMNTIRNPGADPNAYRTFLSQMDSGVNGIRTGLTAGGLPAPATRQHVEQVAQIVAAMAAVPGPQPPVIWPPVPPGPPLIPGGISRDEFVRYRGLIQETAQTARQSARVLRSVIPGGWGTTRLLAEVDGFVTSVDRLRTGLRVGMPVNDLRIQIDGVRNELAGLTGRIQTEVRDARAIQSWYQTVLTFNRLAAMIGVPAAPGVPAIPPPPPPVPGVPGVPGLPVGPGFGNVPGAIAAIDRGISECDALIAAFGPYVYHNPAVPRLQQELRVVRNNFVGLRQAVQRNPNRNDLQARYSTIKVAMNTRVSLYWNQAVTGARVQNAPPLTGLTIAVQDTGRLLRLN
ncbi:DUF4214 domain-containing protein [Fimbriiglobus ruber]|uniref:Uncharacterized protein n=1 Tax=Fimbriiglobus ruber TaxID=1908690 RepID=A0A225DYI6_9BACT|nr:DUF4214 domain-containing protein [Fimbriiglobus ruber]OWK46392.1 hypothetical protein FRUB_00091 [Fimbriiglobus ruber]